MIVFQSLFRKQKKKEREIILPITVILLSLFGILMIYEASNVNAYQQFGDKYYFVKDQVVWLALGICSMFIISKIHYVYILKYSFYLLLTSIVSLIAVFLPGLGVRALGATRWIGIGLFRFQPSELAKVIMVLYLASWLSSEKKRKLSSFLLLLGIVVGLVILQPDLGTAIVLTGTFTVMYFLSGAPIRHFMFLIPCFIAAVYVLTIISPYRFARLVTFLNPNNDPLGTSYHIRQVLVSFASGGMWGLGLGASRQKYQFLPEATTDSIFAIVGEEMGYIGASLLIFFYIFLLVRIAKIVQKTKNKQAYLLSCGVFSLLTFQTIMNLGSMVVVFPLTGIPLPFLSYGGSNLIISLAGVGMLLNIDAYESKNC